MEIDQKTKDMIQERFKAIEYESQKWTAAWRDIAKYEAPTRGRFDDLPNRGKMIDHKTILDGHATQASKIMASGMQSGMTSPTRPWIALRVKDPELMAKPNVRMWLDEVTKLMLDVCSDSNIYSVFYSMYEEIANFGVTAAIILEDYDDVIRGRSFTIGEYFLGINAKGVVDTFGRKMQMTVSQVVDAFGIENVSSSVKTAYEGNRVDDWVKINHLIEPNTRRVDGFVDQQNMPFRSVYWEVGQSNLLLAFKGFEEFPVIAPRWDTVTTDTVYGYGPGWNALGNVKQLQKTVLDKLLAQEKAHNPPVQKDSSVEGHVNLLPGGVTTTSSALPNAGVRPAYQVNANLESFIELIGELKASINKDFFVDLFLMMINFDKSNMTATEVAERQQEKIMMMGPILEKLQSEMLDPFVERLYGILNRNAMLPEPPEEIMDMAIEPEYVSILAQAQKAVGVNSISRVLGFIGGAAPIYPDAPDNIDIDEAIREVAILEGVPAKLILEKKVVQQIREQRAQAQQMQQQMAMASQGAKAAKDLANAKTSEPSALTAATAAAGMATGTQ